MLAQLGREYIPGHAPADIFSSETSLNAAGQSWIAAYTTTKTARRGATVARPAHNTVEIEGYDQAEMWGAFRVARRGYPRLVNWRPSANGFDLACWHDGYCPLPGLPKHRRSFLWKKSGAL